MNKTTLARILFIALAIFALTPFSSSALALLAGIILASTVGNPFPDFTKKHTATLLQYSVVGLGAGMNLQVVGVVGAKGIGYTVTGIVLTFLVGTLLAKMLKTAKPLSTLITVGTAICGGSAIAATGPVIKAEHEDMSVSLG